MSTFKLPHIRKQSCRPYPESGAGTVEYVIVVLVAIVIGAGLLAFGNQVSGQVSKTGISISSWFSKANGTAPVGPEAEMPAVRVDLAVRPVIQQRHGQVPLICEWSLSVAIPIWTNASSFSSDASPLMMK